MNETIDNFVTRPKKKLKKNNLENQTGEMQNKTSIGQAEPQTKPNDNLLTAMDHDYADRHFIREAAMDHDYADRHFIREAEICINECLNLSMNWVEVFTLVDQLFCLCSNYTKSSFVFRQLLRMLKENSLDLRIIVVFLHDGGDYLGRWVPLDETTIENIQIPATRNSFRSQQDMLRLFLEFSGAARGIISEKGIHPHPDPDFRCSVFFKHLVNQNLINKIYNIPLLLSYGLKLEFTDDLYNHIMCNFSSVMSSYNFTTTMSRHPNPKRMLLVLVVITHSYYLESVQTDNALRILWRSIPEPYLCKKEITEIFAGYNGTSFDRCDPDFIMLQYKELVCEGEFSEMAQPRSLGHLSRCEIRNAMAANMVLPYGVKALPIPEALQSYVLLES